ncbi:Nucleoside 5-triphosphatase RdgB (dHAPTP, dITP, XTP-specific) [Thioalkalivibrio nitratireducens DSM 14787]|uniref:dITP/XTP pyrophosphatase n=1 Tax=Thioalkalivibrio nitratireducens (strain DSM 14787 / UNIQEM 213 / ALEN2) TaxID=1255043 RepID=L0E3J9_THIND|nr:Nucleoside 5-triphosphatase RdgB (dHAPTP, dITP, XTP-specific) [Thioalkalivibrio nitratireducens DSM 14787]
MNMTPLVLASGNPGKIREFTTLLQPIGIELIPQSHWSVPEAEETGLTFVENAILKARNAAAHTGMPALADDSGIEVDALNGQPGIYSARYAGPDADDTDNNEKLLEALAGVPRPQRTARFRCVMAFLAHAEDPSPILAEGTWEGLIATKPSGHGGFGYDPIFILPQYGRTSADVPEQVKNRRSHRAQALNAMVAQLTRRMARG